MLQHGDTFRRWLRTNTARRPRATRTPIRSGSSETMRALDIFLHRPEVHNALDAAMRDALCDAFDLVAADPSISEVHLRGDGPSLCSGGDLTEFGIATDAGAAHLLRVERSVGRRLHDNASKVTAHLHGSCVGAGIEIAAFASACRRGSGHDDPSARGRHGSHPRRGRHREHPAGASVATAPRTSRSPASPSTRPRPRRGDSSTSSRRAVARSLRRGRRRRPPRRCGRWPVRRCRGSWRRPAGSLRTSSGVPSAMTSPSSRQYTRSLMLMISGMSCSMTSTDASSSRLDVLDDAARTPRSRAGRGRRWARRGRARGRRARAGRRARRCAGCRSTDPRCTRRRSGRGRGSRSARRPRRAASRSMRIDGGRHRAADEQAGAVAGLERELDRLAHGELGEQGRGLERAAEPPTGPGRRRQRRHALAEELDASRCSGTKPPMAFISVVLPAPLVPISPTISSAPTSMRHVVARRRCRRSCTLMSVGPQRGRARRAAAPRSRRLGATAAIVCCCFAGRRAHPSLGDVEQRRRGPSSRSGRGRRGSRAAGRAGRCST